MRKVIVGLLVLGSLSSYADVIKSVSCNSKSVSYTVTITSEFAPGSKVLTNVALTKFSVGPDGTARIESDEEAVGQDIIFDNIKSAKKFYTQNNVTLESQDGSTFILSLKKSSLIVINAGSKTVKKLECN